MESLRKVFAYRLKELRGDRTQSDFAEKLDLSLRTYQELESGNVPQRKTLDKIVEKLDLPSETQLFLDPDLSTSTASLESFRLRAIARLATLDHLKFEELAPALSALTGEPLVASEKKESPG